MTGEARKSLTEAIRAAQDGAAEAVRENRIPAKYRSAVKRYFGDMKSPAED